MTESEAHAWLADERSSLGNHNAMCAGDYGLASVRAEQENAAMMEQAYWVLRARKDGLL